MTEFPVRSELTQAQMTGLLRLGDVVIPGDDELPSFSESGCAPAISRMLPFMHEADRSSLLALLAFCAKAPKPVLRGIVAGAGAGRGLPGPLGGSLRMANIGIKGVVFSLYYADVADAGIRDSLDWRAEMNDHLEEGR